MKYTIFDIETNGLYQDVTKLHCLSYQIFEDGILLSKNTLVDTELIKNFVEQQECIVGHNIIRYDLPVLEKLVGVKYSKKIIDTLAISWYLFPERHKHGLESYGEEFHVAKPIIEDWNNLGIEEYKHRCETDVEINKILWLAQEDYLSKIYEGNFDRIIGYLNFKFQCLLEQELVGITLDINLCKKTKLNLKLVVEEKVGVLSAVMPKNLGNVLKKRPTVFYKKDGSLTNSSKKWVEDLKELNLPEDTEVIYEMPNPGSSVQLKKWLLTLGWKPITFKVSKSTGEKVAQISLPMGQGICPSVKELYSKEPALEALEGLYIAQHRIGLIKSYFENMDKQGKIYATAHGFTNTLRLKHSVPVNFTAGLKQL